MDTRRFRYLWTADLPALHGDFLMSTYRAACGTDVPEGAVFMEVDAEETEGEARHFCELATDPASGILAVVASGKPESPGFEAHLDAIAHPKLAGVRRVLHTRPDEISQSALFRENIRTLGRRGLTFDICMLQRQLPLAAELVRACPETTFILDHCGVPDIAANDAPSGAGFLAWRDGLRLLAAEPNVFCKISGISVYAAEGDRTVDGLGPYVATVLETFGPTRCVWGGDWPVVNLGCGIAEWIRISRALLGSLSADEQNAVFRTNALRVYCNHS